MCDSNMDAQSTSRPVHPNQGWRWRQHRQGVRHVRIQHGITVNPNQGWRWRQHRQGVRHVRIQHGCTEHQSAGEPQSGLEVAAATRKPTAGCSGSTSGLWRFRIGPPKTGNEESDIKVDITVHATAVVARLGSGTISNESSRSEV